MDPQEFENQFGLPLHEWEFPEFYKQQRGRTWYTFITIGVVGLAGYAIATQNFLFALIILLFLIILFLHTRMEPEILQCILTDRGVCVGNRFYRYKDIGSFWMLYQPPELRHIYFDFVGTFRPHLVISVENENPVAIRDTLRTFLKEDLDKEEEPIADAVARLLKL